MSSLPTPGTPCIIIWLGSDGKPKCEIPSLNGARNQRPEIVTQEQMEILYDFAQRQREKQTSDAIKRNGILWPICAKKHGTDFANKNIGKTKRTPSGGITTVHPTRSRKQQAWDAWDHEMSILANQIESEDQMTDTRQRREILRQIPHGTELTPFQMHEIVKKTLARYGFTQEEIHAAQLSKRPAAGISAPHKARSDIVEFLNGL